MGPGSRDGSREFLLRSCAVLIHDDRVLMQEAGGRRGNPTYALPGGHVEFGETLAECLSREVYEESGLNVEAEKLIYVHENFYTLRNVVTHEVGFYFLVDLNSDFPPPDRDGYVPSKEEHIRMRLLTIGRLREFDVQPTFLRERLPIDAGDLFRSPPLHLVTRES